jgi:hypothetical protein
MAEDEDKKVRPVDKQDDSRIWAQCALMDNLTAVAAKVGSPAPGEISNPADWGGDAWSPGKGKLTRHQADANFDALMQPEGIDQSIPEDIILLQALPEMTLSLLNRSPGAERLFNMTTAQMSSLVPKISIEVKDGETWDPIKFTGHFDAEYFKKKQKMVLSSSSIERQNKIGEVLSGRGDRSESGIKKFTFEFDNNMHYERNMKASLTLYFQSLFDLTTSEYSRLFKLSDLEGIQEPTSTKAKEATTKLRIAEMGRQLRYWGLRGVQQIDATKLGGKVPDLSFSRDSGIQFLAYGEGSLLNPLADKYFHKARPLFTGADPASTAASARYKYLKATIGWQNPGYSGASTSRPAGFDKGLKDAIDIAQRTLLLNMTEYNISFKEQGQVELVLNYVASIDTDIRQGNGADILGGLFTSKPGINPLYEYLPIDSTEVAQENLYSSLDKSSLVGRLSRDTNFPPNAQNILVQQAPYPSTDFLSGLELESKASIEMRQGRRVEVDGEVTNSGYGVEVRGMGAGYLKTRFSTQHASEQYGTVFLVQEAGVINEIKLIEMELALLREEWDYNGGTSTDSAEKDKKLQTERLKKHKKTISRQKEFLSSAQKVLAILHKRRRAENTGGMLSQFIYGWTAHAIILSPSSVGDSGLKVDDASAMNEAKSSLSSRAKESSFRAQIISSSDGFSGSVTDGTDYAFTTSPVRKRLKQMVASYGTKKQKEGLAAGTNVSLSDKLVYSTIFVKFGDILDKLLKATRAWSSREDYEIVLGTFRKIDFFTGKTHIYNLADVPIPAEIIGQWFFNRILDTDRKTYPLRTAIRDIISDMLTPAIDKYCSSYSSEARKDVEMSILTTLASKSTMQSRKNSVSQVNSGGHGSSGAYWENSDEVINVGETAAMAHFAKGSEDLRTYLVIHTTPLVMSGGNPMIDARYGIYHLVLGRDKGLVKRIDFKRKEMPYLETMNIENANAQGVLAIPMDATVEMFGNSLFLHGQIVYINAEMGLGRAVADTLKVGGYYMVTKVTNSLDSSGWQTTLNCIWLSERDGNTEMSERR